MRQGRSITHPTTGPRARRAAALVAALAVLATLLAMPGRAEAQAPPEPAGPTLTVEPITVPDTTYTSDRTISGEGFTPGSTVILEQCRPNGVLGTDPAVPLGEPVDCAPFGERIIDFGVPILTIDPNLNTVDPDGTFSTTETVGQNWSLPGWLLSATCDQACWILAVDTASQELARTYYYWSCPQYAPVADLQVDVSGGVAPLPVHADASGSYGVGSCAPAIVSYTFDFGDGTVIGPQAGATASHTYTAPGQYTLTVTVVDAEGESDSTSVLVTVTATGPSIVPGAAGVTEGDAGTTTLEVPLTLSSPAAQPVTVDWQTLDTGAAGIATAGTDYLAASGTATFAPGETATSVTITVKGDTIDEPPLYLGEWILVAFSNASANATLDTSFFGLGIGIVIDDDPPPTILPGSAGVTEGDAGTVTLQVPVRLSNPSAEVVTVDWQTLDTGAAGIATADVDYLAASGTASFAPGQTTAFVTITVNGDTVDDPPLYLGEWILVAFSNPSANATLDTSFFGLGIGVIVDDDPT